MSARRLVYVVDDDQSFRTATMRMLTEAGLTVRGYASGAELLAYLPGHTATEEAGCVLADLCMPGIDGLQLQEACAAAGVVLPFVFFTGHGNVPSAVSAMRQGAVDFLDKCAPKDALLAALERAFKRDMEARLARIRREQLEHRFAALTERELEVLGQVGVLYHWLEVLGAGAILGGMVLGAIGASVVLLGVGLAVYARIYLGRNWGMPMSRKEEPELVTGGPYAFVRHPIYTGIVLAMLGSAIGESVIWVVMLTVFAPYFVYSARREEQLIREQFPAQYPDYMRRTKMIVPFVL